jgi:protein required for attachment to host cells
MARLKIASGTWIVVGDGEKALFLRNDGMPEVPDLRCVAIREQSGGKVDETDRRMAHLASAAQRRGVPTHNEKAERRFVGRVADYLNAAAHDERYDHLIVVAPPRTLETLRTRLSGEAKACVQAEIDRDLTRLTIADIETILMSAG